MYFFFNDTATTEIYTLSLHDALPISLCLQEKVNEFLWDLKHSDAGLENNPGPAPMHVNFI